MSTNFYPSKLLLFGEYTVLHHGMALAIPYPDYYGKWAMEPIMSNKEKIFSSFIDYLTDLEAIHLDLDRLLLDYNHGLQFVSSIPIGYGIGSSGAFSAAIYDRYSLTKTHNLEKLKNQLALIESFFHGESSGIDPLVSYTSKVILKSKEGELSALPTIQHDLLDKLELIDSNQPRSSAKFIQIYKEKLQEDSFIEQMQKLTYYQDQAINIITKDTQKGDLLSIIKIISTLQLNHLSEMIPGHIKKDWIAGLKQDEYFYKLCGAGGGGFFLKFKL